MRFVVAVFIRQRRDIRSGPNGRGMTAYIRRRFILTTAFLVYWTIFKGQDADAKNPTLEMTVFSNYNLLHHFCIFDKIPSIVD